MTTPSEREWSAIERRAHEVVVQWALRQATGEDDGSLDDAIEALRDSMPRDAFEAALAGARDRPPGEEATPPGWCVDEFDEGWVAFLCEHNELDGEAFPDKEGAVAHAWRRYKAGYGYARPDVAQEALHQLLASCRAYLILAGVGPCRDMLVAAVKDGQSALDAVRARTTEPAAPEAAPAPSPVGGPKRPEYEPHDRGAALGYFIEECGEALAAAGKIVRWGWESYNPELPEGEREINEAWLLREVADVEQAIVRLRRFTRCQAIPQEDL